MQTSSAAVMVFVHFGFGLLIVPGFDLLFVIRLRFALDLHYKPKWLTSAA